MAKHMGRWAKGASATGFFRERSAPNKPVEDLPTMPLLCRGCEQKFGNWESTFKDHVFDPWSTRLDASDPDLLPQDVQFERSEWMDRLVLSLCWRALHLSNEGKRLTTLSPMAEAAHQEWRRGLLGGTHPVSSFFWVVQARKMDEILRYLGHRGNRAYIFSTTEISSRETGLHGNSQLTAVYQDGSEQGAAFQIDEWFQTSLVKGYGFAFLGAHIPQSLPLIPQVVFLNLVTASVLKSSIEQHRDLGANLSLKQREKTEDAESKNRKSAKPALIMRLKMADERERDRAAAKP